MPKAPSLGGLLDLFELIFLCLGAGEGRGVRGSGGSRRRGGAEGCLGGGGGG